MIALTCKRNVRRFTKRDIFDKTHKIQNKHVQGMDEMRDGDNDERNVTDEIGSSSGAAEGQEVF